MKYQKPTIERIVLDREISLILQSEYDPWGDPVTKVEKDYRENTEDPFNA
ncbi:MAG: hypothetical protein PHQ26_09770 [Bacteroidales bacterium]|nr:hypothetical protein [Bacteroidales bacterium]MDD3167061.1 hypothetical protein [Bacteroidales bacterium]MDD4771749.1 hypothetical protein [Bacteroidales bacterium]